MKIQNPNMASQSLSLRYTRDDEGRSVLCTGDSQGVFDVSERDARFLLGTKGWREVQTPSKQAPPLDDVGDDQADGDQAAADIEGLRTKAAAMEMAAQYGITLDEEMKLSEMKEKLEAELFEED